MEAQITAGVKTPVLSSRLGPEGSVGDKGKKRESEALSRTQSTERDEQVSLCRLKIGEHICDVFFFSFLPCCRFVSRICFSCYIISLSQKRRLHTL